MYPGIDLWYSTRRATAWGGVQPGPQDKLEFMRRFTLLARYAPPNERYLAVHRLAKSAQEDHNEHRPETVVCVCVCVKRGKSIFHTIGWETWRWLEGSLCPICGMDLRLFVEIVIPPRGSIAMIFFFWVVTRYFVKAR